MTPTTAGRGRRLQIRLALLYFGAFVGSGALLLLVTLALFQHKTATSVSAVPVSVLPGRGPLSAGITAGEQHSTDVHQLLVVSALALLITAAASIGIGWLIAGRLLRPLRAMTAAARHISATNLHERLDMGGPDDELGELAATLDDLFGRLETSFESQRHFVANASHELRTPLTVERTLLQVALADPEASAGELRSTCEKVLALGREEELLIDGLLTLATGERGIERWEAIDLGAIVGDAVASRQGEADRRWLHVEADLPTAPMAGDPSLVESLVGNLIDNALRHNLPDGHVWISTLAHQGQATVSVSNTGPVVPPGEVERLFGPFQRLGRDRVGRAEGHGLGLAIVAAIAAAHEATLRATARPDGGLTVAVTFIANHPTA